MRTNRTLNALGRGMMFLLWKIYVKFLDWTCTMKVVGDLDKFLNRPEPFLLTCWHQDMFNTVGYLFRFIPRRKFAVLVSLSGEGNLGDYLLRRFGLHTVRGSSARKGTEALFELSQLVNREGYVGIIICDGPRPPARKARSGIVTLARMTGRPILMVRSRGTRQWMFKTTWPSFTLACPFSEVVLMSDDPLFVPVQVNKEETERYRREVENRLNHLAERAEEWVRERKKGSQCQPRMGEKQ